MLIGLDLRMLGGGSGISRYISELSKKILETDQANRYVLFFNKIDEEARAYAKFGHKMVETGIKHYSIAEQFSLPGILNQENLDLMHFPHFNAPIMYRRPFVVTIHDLTHTKFPGRKKSHWLFRVAYNMVIRHAIRRARKIIAVSNSTKQEVIDYFQIPEKRIEVVYEAANPDYRMINKDDAFDHVSKKFGISKPYILYVGVWRRYKNLSALSAAFDRLKDMKLDGQLVLAGEPDPFYPEIKEQVLGIKHKTDVKVLGRVSDEDLIYLYNAAELFVLPSIAEGFGLPLLEAANCGIPIACSDIPVLREVMGNGAEYFDPENLDNMVGVMKGILTNARKAEDLANLGLKRIRYFSWKKAAEQTIKVYESAL